MTATATDIFSPKRRGMAAFGAAVLLATGAMTSPALAQAGNDPAVVTIPAPAPAPADPARLAEAKRTIDFIFPLGTYRKLMGGNFSKMMGSISTQMLDMPVRDIAALGGMPAEETEKMSDATMRQVMEIIDPAFEQRTTLMFDGMMAGMTEIMNDFEPEIREALVEAYAGQFTAPQLQEINRFFATPTGSLYAEKAMTLAMDPAFTQKIMKLTPRLMQQMPQIVKKATEKTKSLPPRRSYASLDKADQGKLAKLLNLQPAETAKAVDAIEKQQRKHETETP